MAEAEPEPAVPSSTDKGESAAGLLFLGMIPGSLVAAIAKLAVTYLNERTERGTAGISL